MELSTQIKEARRKLGLTQQEAAKRWEIPLPTLRHWEQSQNSPRGLALKHLRQILDPILADSTPSASSVSPAPPAVKPPPKQKRARRKR